MNAPDRRTKLLQTAAGLVFLAVAAVLVLIVVNASGGDDSGDVTIEGAAAVNEQLAGIPQEVMRLGDPSAPVELIEFGDLQCPACKIYAEEVLPPIIENQVRRGEVRIEFRNFPIIGSQSLPAGAAALAAGQQGRGWNFVELFYRNQGQENSGYADDAFLRAVAVEAGVEDIARWNQDRAKLTSYVESHAQQAEDLGFDATPSFAIEGPGTDGLEPLGTPGSTSELEEAIEGAS